MYRNDQHQNRNQHQGVPAGYNRRGRRQSQAEYDAYDAPNPQPTRIEAHATPRGGKAVVTAADNPDAWVESTLWANLGDVA